MIHRILHFKHEVSFEIYQSHTKVIYIDIIMNVIMF